MEDTVTADRLLGGRVVLSQPLRGYRAAIDPVLLAAAVPAQAGESVIELGTGTGAAALCLTARVPGVAVTGVEIEPGIAALAGRNALANGVAERFRVVLANVETPGALGTASFDHAMANPPYHEAATHPPSPEPAKARANTAPATGLAVWIERALARLRPGGSLTLIQRADRLGEILSALGARAGRIGVLPVQPRADAPASRIIVQAVKGRRTPLVLLPPLVLHEADGRYTAAAERILFDVVPLTLAA